MAYEQESSLINGQPNNTAASTPDSLQGGWTKATLSSSTDVDYFKVTTTSAALIKVDLTNLLLTDTNYWNLSLVDGNGDYVSSLTTTVTGTPLVSGSSNTGTTLAVTGLTSSSVPVGSRFTLATSSSDTTIYTVTSATTVSSGACTLTLDQDLPSSLTASTALVFDPTQTLVAGVSAELTGQVVAAGTYYVKVIAANTSNAEYAVRATVLPTIESTGENGSKEDASDALTNNRLLADAWMSGALSSSTDVDVWTFSSVTMPADFSIDFAAATGSQTTPQWKIVVAQWTSSGEQPLLSANASNISTATDAAASTGTSASFLVDDARYTTAATYTVTVSAVSSTVFSTGAYKLKVSGTGIDQNDTPILSIDTASSSTPGLLIDSGVSRSIKAGATSKVALSTLFSVSDADSDGGQSIATYKLSLTKATGETGSVSGSIKLLEADGSVVTGSVTYSMDSTITLTAAQMAKAYLYAGTVTGSLSLYIQAFDSSSTLDNSGASSVMLQTLRVVSTDVGVTATTDGTLSLEEGGSASTETLSFVLTAAPTQDVKVYLEQDSNSRFSFGSSVLTFTSANWSTAQTVAVTARDNATNEGAHTGQINFRVVSADSQYDGYSIASLTVAIADPSNHLPTGGVSFTGTTTEDQVLTAVTTALADSDTLGVLSYQWQRSTDGTVWSDISSATGTTYTLGDADVSKSIRLAVSYVDGQGTSETVNSSASTSSVVGVNDSHTGSITISGTAKQGQTLTAVSTLVDVDGLGTISYQWKAGAVNITGATSSTYVLTQAEVGKLISVTASYTDAQGTAESESSETVQAIALGKTADMQAYIWKSHTLLSGVALTASTYSSTSNSLGAASFTPVTETSLSLTASRAIPTAEAKATTDAVSLQDAIAILKMIVGLPVNGTTNGVANALSPYQALAADFNADGEVGLQDAIGVLKLVVGLTAPEPTWHFLNELDTTVAAKANLQPGAVQTTVTVDLTGTSPVHVGLVAYLSGDVDGSYAGATGASDLDITEPSYFVSLVANHPGVLSAAQFGG